MSQSKIAGFYRQKDQPKEVEKKYPKQQADSRLMNSALKQSPHIRRGATVLSALYAGKLCLRVKGMSESLLQ